ncbi:MAG: aspartate kinase [Tissierellia bacterium]|nr:aspartate kinase [Tissierellia bacterium]
MNNIVVCKFGGSSLSDAEQFRKVKAIIDGNEERKIVVPSAPGKGKKEKHKVTDLLLMSHQLGIHKLNFDEVFNIVKKRFISIKEGLGLNTDIETELDIIYENIKKGAEQAYCASRGEYLNGLLLSDYLGYRFVDATEVICINEEKPDVETSCEWIRSKISVEDKVVVPGYYGVNNEGKIATFSRGGSDVTGAIMAAGVEAKLYENWTDVSGFMIADPKVVSEPKPINSLSYKELRELSYMGAPVLHEDAVFPLKSLRIPIQILNTNCPEDRGTLIISDDSFETVGRVITGIAGKKDFTAIYVEKLFLAEEEGMFRKLVSIFETNKIKIEHMATSIDTISFVVPTQQIEGKEKKIAEEISIYCGTDNVEFSKGLAVIAVVGRGMVNTKGTSAIIFKALAMAGINIRMISQGSSELNIVIGVKNEDFEGAIKAIYNQSKEM